MDWKWRAYAGFLSSSLRQWAQTWQPSLKLACPHGHPMAYSVTIISNPPAQQSVRPVTV